MRKPDNSYATVSCRPCISNWWIIPHTTVCKHTWVCDVTQLQRIISPAWRR